MSFGCQHSVGDLLSRYIDGVPFPCVVLSLQPSNRYRLLYLDDLATEDCVAGGEVGRMDDVAQREWREKMERPEWKERQKVVRQARVGDFPPGIVVKEEGDAAKPKKTKKKKDKSESKSWASSQGDDCSSSSDDDDNDYDGDTPSSPYSDPHSRPPRVIVHQHPSSLGGGGGVVGDGDGEGGEGEEGGEMQGDTAYTIQGDKPLPRGGGLKALRALRK